MDLRECGDVPLLRSGLWVSSGHLDQVLCGLIGQINVSQRIDNLWDQFSMLDQGSMSVYEYKAIFHELSRHATIFLPTEKERVWCFVC